MGILSVLGCGGVQSVTNRQAPPITLPAGIDPSGRLRHVPHGTAVYVLTPRVVTWLDADAAASHQFSVAQFKIASMTNQGSTTIVMLTSGKRYEARTASISWKATGERDIGFVAPGRSVPVELKGLTPSYIVP